MVGKPQREHAKITMQATVSDEAYSGVQPLLLTDEPCIKSYSSLFETIILLSEHMYNVEPNNSFISNLVRLKAQRQIEQLEDPSNAKPRRIHVTIDSRAYNFIDMLKKRYGTIFSSRSEIADLLLLNIGRNCNTANDFNYYLKRLKEVLLLYPLRSH